MKVLPAIIASFIITCLVAAAMFVIGANALVNQNVAPVKDTPATSAAAQAGSAAADPQSGDLTVQQLQDLVQQYQQREKQYQQELNKAAASLNQANGQISQYQQLLMDMQQAGIIRISRDGQILVPRSRLSFDNDNDED